MVKWLRKLLLEAADRAAAKELFEMRVKYAALHVALSREVNAHAETAAKLKAVAEASEVKGRWLVQVIQMLKDEGYVVSFDLSEEEAALLKGPVGIA